MRENICPPDHKHALTSTCYTTHKCGCADCRARRARDGRASAERARKGLAQLQVDVHPVHKHVRALMSDGWRIADIAKVAGVSVPTVARISRLAVRSVEEGVADAVLGTRPDMRRRGEPAKMLDATGTRRRLQALAAHGWSLRFLMERLGRPASSAYWYMRSTKVTPRVAAAISALYDELWDVTPPQRTQAEEQVYRRVKAHAQKQGWVPPLMWDDDEIDNPEAAPAAVDDLGTIRDRNDPARVEAAIAGERVALSPRERREVVQRLHSRRWSARRIAERAGCERKTVERIRAELGLPTFDQKEIRDAA